MAKVYEFKPPLTQGHIKEIEADVLSTIPEYEVPQREYFLDCWRSLVEYVTVTLHERENFSMSIGFFVPDYHNKEERRLFNQDNIWVKVRVTGGFMSAFRSKYMATHAGLAKIDWKNRTAEIIMTGGVKFGGMVAASVLESKDLDGLGQSRKSASTFVAIKFKERTNQARIDRMKGIRYTPAEIYHSLRSIPQSLLHIKIATGEFRDFAASMFNALDRYDNSNSLNLQEFLELWSDVIGLPRSEGVVYYSRIAQNSEISQDQFIDLFEKILTWRVIARESKGNHPVSDKILRAKAAVDRFYQGIIDKYYETMSFNERYDEFAMEICKEIGEVKTGAIAKEDFVEFLTTQQVTPEYADMIYSSIDPSGVSMTFAQFREYFYRFLLYKHSETSTEQFAFCTVLVSYLMLQPNDSLQSLRPCDLSVSITRLFAAVNATDFLTYDQFVSIDESMNEALPQAARTYEESYIRFGMYAKEVRSGEWVVPIEKYSDIIEAMLIYVRQVKSELERSFTINIAISEAFHTGDTAKALSLNNELYSVYAVQGRIALQNYVRLMELLPGSTASKVRNLGRELVVKLEEKAEVSFDAIKKMKEKSSEEQCKMILISILKVPFLSLKAYQYAQHKHFLAAQQIFTVIYPYSPQHDSALFSSYKGAFSDMFQCEATYVDSLYVKYAGEQGLTTQGLAGLLGDMVAKLVAFKSAVERK